MSINVNFLRVSLQILIFYGPQALGQPISITITQKRETKDLQKENLF